MSHPVFLECPPWPRMPEGRRGELKTYFERRGPALSACDTVPLFWQAVFRPGDLRYAYKVDDFDPILHKAELDDYLDGASQHDIEARYPYLVTTRTAAQNRLAELRAPLLALIGDRFQPIYDAFAEHIGDCYGPYVLLRTSCLPDIVAGAVWLSAILERMEALAHNSILYPALQSEIDALRGVRDRDAIWRLSGIDVENGEAAGWPSAALIRDHPRFAPSRRTAAVTPLAPRDAVREFAHHRPAATLDTVVEWLLILLLGVICAGTWVVTGLSWMSTLATAGMVGLLVMGLRRIRLRY